MYSNSRQKNSIKKKGTDSSVKSNVMEYRLSEVDDDLAYKYYKKKMGIKDSEDLRESSQDNHQNMLQSNSSSSEDLIENPPIDKRLQQPAAQSSAHLRPRPKTISETIEDTSSGPKERIIGLSSSSSHPAVSDDEEENFRGHFQVVKASQQSDNKTSGEFGGRKPSNKPRPTFGVAEDGEEMVGKNVQNYIAFTNEPQEEFDGYDEPEPITPNEGGVEFGRQHFGHL
jgi:hypothetical protein